MAEKNKNPMLNMNKLGTSQPKKPDQDTQKKPPKLNMAELGSQINKKVLGKKKGLTGEKPGRKTKKDPNLVYTKRTFDMPDVLFNRMNRYLFDNKLNMWEYLVSLIEKDLDENAPKPDE